MLNVQVFLNLYLSLLRLLPGTSCLPGADRDVFFRPPYGRGGCQENTFSPTVSLAKRLQALSRPIHHVPDGYPHVLHRSVSRDGISAAGSPLALTHSLTHSLTHDSTLTARFSPRRLARRATSARSQAGRFVSDPLRSPAVPPPTSPEGLSLTVPERALSMPGVVRAGVGAGTSGEAGGRRAGRRERG
jgi:hypothetical protein